LAVRQAYGDAILIRPAVMFGRDDAFLTPILMLLNRLPVFPMFGNGQMRLEPVYVEDVGQAIAKIMQSDQIGPTMSECGGPRVYSYEEASEDRRERSRHQADIASSPVRRLGRIGSDL
jgi:uncharacterized protein YbjT (DUF2867 family)